MNKKGNRKERYKIWGKGFSKGLKLKAQVDDGSLFEQLSKLSIRKHTT